MVASQAPPTHPPCRSSLCDSPMTHRHVCLHKPKREIWILMENIPMWMVMFLNCQSCTFSINCVYKYIRILCTLYREILPGVSASERIVLRSQGRGWTSGFSYFGSTCFPHLPPVKLVRPARGGQFERGCIIAAERTLASGSPCSPSGTFRTFWKFSV